MDITEVKQWVKTKEGHVYWVVSTDCKTKDYICIRSQLKGDYWIKLDSVVATSEDSYFED